MVILLTLSAGRRVDMRPGASDATCRGNVGGVHQPGIYWTGRWTGILSARVRSAKMARMVLLDSYLRGDRCDRQSLSGTRSVPAWPDSTGLSPPRS